MNQSYLDNEFEKYCSKVFEFAEKKFNKTIKPYLIKNHYSFYTGLYWGYSMQDENGNRIKSESLPKYITEVLDINIPGIKTDYLASFMPEFVYNQNQ